MPQRAIDLKTMMEVRTLTEEDGSQSVFDVLVIDKPEKWLPAKEHTHQISLRTPGTNNAKRFNLSAISYKDWEKIEDSNPLPEAKMDDYGQENVNDPSYLEAHAKVAEQRNILFVEASLGEKIPGEKPEDKIVWLSKRSAGEFERLVSTIRNTMGAISDGSLLDQYVAATMALANKTPVVVSEVKSLADWEEVSSNDSYGSFRICRPFENYIVEFPVKAISTEQRMQIEKLCNPPIAPKGPYVDPITNRIDPRRVAPNYKDPHYLSKVNQMHAKKMLLLVQAALTFDIPGSNDEECMKWLTDRTVGDVIKLRRFIDEELLGYKQQFDSFI